MSPRNPVRPLTRGLALLFVASLLCLSSCHVHHLRVGMGGNGVSSTERTQYYLFFGLVRLNSIDVQQEVAGLNSYDVYTECGFWDLCLMPLFLPLTVTTRTLTIEE